MQRSAAHEALFTHSMFLQIQHRPVTQSENNIHPLNDKGSNNNTSKSSSDLTFEAIHQLVIETRASLDILTEMVCLIYADGDEEKYRQTLDALEYRQKEAESRILDAMGRDGGTSAP